MLRTVEFILPSNAPSWDPFPSSETYFTNFRDDIRAPNGRRLVAVQLVSHDGKMVTEVPRYWVRDLEPYNDLPRRLVEPLPEDKSLLQPIGQTVRKEGYQGHIRFWAETFWRHFEYTD